MIFICAQPATFFYAWNVEVMLDSFMRTGIPQENIHIVCAKGDNYYEGWRNLSHRYSNVKFFFYEDSRETKGYVSSIRPNILKQHFSENPYLSKEVIFYHDCDIIFTKPINWEQYMNDDFWYGSNCSDYLGYDCILRKGEDVLDKMCEISNIDKNLIKENQNNSIGAQYVLKNIDSRFWESIENDSERLHAEITELSERKARENPEYEKLVIYCADMWALLWNGWKEGHRTICSEDLSFCWAPRGKSSFESHNIFHNAGIQRDMQEEYFYKYNYLNKLPYFDNLEIRTDTASYEYWKEIKRTGENTVLF